MKKIKILFTDNSEKEINFSDITEIKIFGDKGIELDKTILSIIEKPNTTLSNLWLNYFSNLDVLTIDKIIINDMISINNITQMFFSLNIEEDNFQGELVFYFNSVNGDTF